MAQAPIPELHFVDACSDCGYRQVTLPEPLPVVGDDFDWLVRDYDGFRLAMLEELAARFPERQRWTPADMEVVLVEALSVLLDQQSDMLDRVQAEAFLQTARRPDSVRRLLAMIGFDAVANADSSAQIANATGTPSETTEQQRQRLSGFQFGLQQYLPEYPDVLAELTASQQTQLDAFLLEPAEANAGALALVQQVLDNAPDLVTRVQHDQLARYWQQYPSAMDAARAAGPRAIHTQKRMVTASDYALRLSEHPLVLRAHTEDSWSGAWRTLSVAVNLSNNVLLDQSLSATAVGGATQLQVLQRQVNEFHRQREIKSPDWAAQPSARALLRSFLDAYRMATQEVFLQDAEFVGINISLSVRLAPQYFQSEVRRAIEQAMGAGLGGFFAPGRLQFGEDLFSSDLIEVLMALEGVESVCLNRFKRVGKRYADQSDAGRIRLDGLEIGICLNSATQPALGILRLVMHGGLRG